MSVYSWLSHLSTWHLVHIGGATLSIESNHVAMVFNSEQQLFHICKVWNSYLVHDAQQESALPPSLYAHDIC